MNRSRVITWREAGRPCSSASASAVRPVQVADAASVTAAMAMTSGAAFVLFISRYHATGSTVANVTTPSTADTATYPLGRLFTVRRSN